MSLKDTFKVGDIVYRASKTWWFRNGSPYKVIKVTDKQLKLEDAREDEPRYGGRGVDTVNAEAAKEFYHDFNACMEACAQIHEEKAASYREQAELEERDAAEWRAQKK